MRKNKKQIILFVFIKKWNNFVKNIIETICQLIVILFLAHSLSSGRI